ncbi:hypothetical protein JG687_00018521, partial [Phytophthora cactorum]
MTMLRLLNLAENQLTGDIPSSLAGNDALEQMDISNNNIELQLPRSLLGSGFLRSINISHNGFHGDLPELPVFQFLESLDMSSNFLSGAIPPQLSLWGREDPHDPDENSSLSIVDVSNNLLSGDLPVISNLSALQHFNIRNNAFAGLVPEFPPSLHEFAKPADFDGNQLLCPMPAVLLTGNLTCVCGDGYTIKMTEDIVNTSRIKKSDASDDVDQMCSWFTYKCEGFWQDLIVAVCVGAALLRLLYKKIRKLCVGDQAAQQQDESVALMTAVRAHGRTFDGVRYAPMGMISADAMFGSIHD